MTRSLTILPALFLCFVSFPAFAANPVLIGTYKDWNAYMLKEKAGKVCYMVSVPKTAKGNYTKRGDVFAMITHRPSEKTRDVFSYITGYSYKVGSDVTISIDGRKFSMFTYDDTAWAPDAASDRQIGNAIRAGSKMTVKGTSSRGTLTTDTFSLSGSSAAYQKISQACGY